VGIRPFTDESVAFQTTQLIPRHYHLIRGDYGNEPDMIFLSVSDWLVEALSSPKPIHATFHSAKGTSLQELTSIILNGISLITKCTSIRKAYNACCALPGDCELIVNIFESRVNTFDEISLMTHDCEWFRAKLVI
jgi:hypothetical protein